MGDRHRSIVNKRGGGRGRITLVERGKQGDNVLLLYRMTDLHFFELFFQHSIVIAVNKIEKRWPVNSMVLEELDGALGQQAISFLLQPVTYDAFMWTRC